MRAETEQGFSKESRLQRDISHHVCNMARLKIPDGANGRDVGDGSAEHSGDSAYERPQRVQYEGSLPASFQRDVTNIACNAVPLLSNVWELVWDPPCASKLYLHISSFVRWICETQRAHKVLHA